MKPEQINYLITWGFNNPLKLYDNPREAIIHKARKTFGKSLIKNEIVEIILGIDKLELQMK